MKKSLLILAIVLIISVSVWMVLNKQIQEPTTESLKKGVFVSRAANAEELSQKLLVALQNQDAVAFSKLLPTSQEFIDLYPYLKDSTQNPNAGRFIAMFMISENRKMQNRWMSRVEELKKLTYSRVLGPDSIEKRHGIELWRGMKLMVKDTTGTEFDLELYRSLIKSGDGWILYGVNES
jgi:hypothetical protein